MKKRLISLFVALTMLLCLIPGGIRGDLQRGNVHRLRQRHERRGDG